MGAIIGFLGVAIPMCILIGGFMWLMEKFAGTRVVGRYEIARAQRESKEEKVLLEELIKSQPHLINKAIKVCTDKHYSLTSRNILAEYYKIKYGK